VPPARLALILLAVIVLGAATVLLMTALPADLRPWLVPVLLIAALAGRTMGKSR
jgi:cytochrome c-type biogenesis protein CcmE